MKQLTNQDFYQSKQEQRFYIDVTEANGGRDKILVVMDKTLTYGHIVDEILFNITTGERNKVSNKIASMFGFHLDNEDVMTPEDVITAYYHYHHGSVDEEKLYIDVDNEFIVVKDNEGRMESVIIDLRDYYKRNISGITEDYFNFEICPRSPYTTKHIKDKDAFALMCQVIQYQNGMLE